MNPAHLVLEDGTVYRGQWFGSPPPEASMLGQDPAAPNAGRAKLPAGEVIFNTGMAGYNEILTDPSYYGQIIVMTYPHIGNYGTDAQWSECPLGSLRASALVVRSLYRGPVSAGRKPLAEFLERHGTTAISEVDTRALTLRIRQGGSPRGLIMRPARGDELAPSEMQAAAAYLARYPLMEGRDLVSELDGGSAREMNPGGRPHLAVVDCGIKAGILRELLALGCRVSLVPNAASDQDVLGMRPDGVLYSNGPGDPAVLRRLIAQIRGLLGRRPVLGICLGHQLLALAMGASTFKMKFGHHGVNNPVRDERSGAVLITSQNHGFSVEETSLPGRTEVWFRNANDRTIEGIAAPSLPALSVQFHPEAAPGPRDSLWIFRRFLEAI